MADGKVVIDTELNDSGFEKGLNKLKGVAGGIGKAIATGTAMVGTAFATMTVESVKARGSIEQTIGGIEKIFGENANAMIENAEKAYKTAGMSADEYMQTATSFSASLLKGLGGDTEKAVEYADRAMKSMSDNANTYGTDIASIQNAYQGFAKENYTMLDNLKLGYAGTKEGMKQLIKDASNMTDEMKELGVSVDGTSMSFDNIINAIDVMQKHQNIWGTTSKEAMQTFEGSLNMLKASFQNFLSGSGSLEEVSESLVAFIDNTSRIVSEALPSIMDNMINYLPEFITIGVDLIGNIVNGIVQYLPQLLQMGIEMLSSIIMGIAEQMPTLIPQMVDCVLLIVDTLLDNIDLLIDAGIELIIALADGLIQALPKLLEKAPIIIAKLVEAHIKMFPKIIDLGKRLLGKIGEGIIAVLYQIGKWATEIITKFVNAIKEKLAQVKEVGRNIVEGLWEGITNAGTWIKDKVGEFAKGILDGMKNALKIGSPSRLFRDEVGKNIALGIGVGFDKNIGKVFNDMKDSVLAETNSLSDTLGVNSSFGINKNINLQNSLTAIETDRDTNVENNILLDGRVIATQVNKINTRQKLAYGVG